MHCVDTLDFRGGFTRMHAGLAPPLEVQPRIPCAASTAALVADVSGLSSL